jgi:hypothetical protein
MKVANLLLLDGEEIYYQAFSLNFMTHIYARSHNCEKKIRVALGLRRFTKTAISKSQSQKYKKLQNI